MSHHCELQDALKGKNVWPREVNTKQTTLEQSTEGGGAEGYSQNWDLNQQSLNPRPSVLIKPAMPLLVLVTHGLLITEVSHLH